jgi:hypothetical protein
MVRGLPSSKRCVCPDQSAVLGAKSSTSTHSYSSTASSSSRTYSGYSTSRSGCTFSPRGRSSPPPMDRCVYCLWDSLIITVSSETNLKAPRDIRDRPTVHPTLHAATAAPAVVHRPRVGAAPHLPAQQAIYGRAAPRVDAACAPGPGVTEDGFRRDAKQKYDAGVESFGYVICGVDRTWTRRIRGSRGRCARRPLVRL